MSISRTGPRGFGHFVRSLVVVVLIAAFSLGPLLWIAITSLKAPGTEFRTPIEYLPSDPTLENYRTVTGEGFRVQQAILNSFLVSLAAMAGTILLSGFAAYSIARLRFRFRFASILAIQAAGLVPPIIIIAPTFIMLRAAGLVGTLWAMIIPNIAYGIPLATLLLTSYLSRIPLDLEEAASIDGASWFRLYWQIIVPVSAPAILSAGVLSFLGSWGEFMHAFTVSLGLPRLRTVPVAILSYSRAFELQWSWVAAATIIALVPVVTLAVLFQRGVVRGLTSGAVSG
ncbi:MAG: carbohydrate ABC transporter permease [Spirochaetota bacterium]